MAYATGGGGKSVKTSGTVGGDGEISTHITAIAAGSNVTLTSAGSVVTIASSGGGGSGNTLDAAYDQGGAGAGRTITVDQNAVVFAGTGAVDEVVNITANNNGSKPLVVKKDNNFVLTVDTHTAGSIVGLKGPIQTIHSIPGQVKPTDPTAMDLQNGAGDPNFTAKGLLSVLVGGNDNIIGSPQGAPQSSDTSNGNAADSIRCAQAVIVGGALNTIFNQENNAIGSENAGIFSAYRAEIKDDPNERGAVGFNTGIERSVVLGGGTGIIQNSTDTAIIGGSGNGVKNQTQSSIITGGTNAILCHNDSDGPGRSNSIIASDGATMTLELAQAIGTSDETANFGCNNVILGSTGAVITEDPKSCLLVGTNPKATKTGSNRDVSCIIVGGGKANGGSTDTSSGSTMINGIALVGVSYSTTGASSAGQILADNGLVTTGADFAESFEWNDGNPDNEDRVGLFVKLATNDSGAPNGKIEVGGENTIGPVSAAPGFLSNATPMKWKGKHLRDDFDREVKDSEGRPMLNPNYDESHDYISRSARKEWAPIGMVGRLRVRASTNIGVYPSNKSGLTVNVNPDGTVSDAGAKGKYKVIQVVKQKEIWSGPEGVFRRRRQIQDHGYGVVEILVV